MTGVQTCALPICGNDLEAPVVARHPEIGELVEALRDSGASYGAMSGSGSAVFGLFGDRESAESAAGRLKDSTRRAFVTRTLTRAEHQRLARPGGEGPCPSRASVPARRFICRQTSHLLQKQPVVYTYRLRHVATATPDVSLSQFREVSDATAVRRTCCGRGAGRLRRTIAPESQGGASEGGGSGGR